jgi:hypothetical protein
MQLKNIILIILLLLILISLLNKIRKEKFSENKKTLLYYIYKRENELLKMKNINLIEDIGNFDKIFSSNDFTFFLNAGHIIFRKILKNILKISKIYPDIKFAIIDFDLIKHNKLSDNDKIWTKKIYALPVMVTKSKEMIQNYPDIEKKLNKLKRKLY